MDPIVSLSMLRGIPLIEDAAEAFGATYKDRLVGTFGSVGTFSFFPNKLITSGEGGLCITSTPELKSEIDLLRGQGMNPKLRYVFEVPGYNFRMTGIQASLLSAQMHRLEALWQERERSEERYRKELKGIVTFPDATYSFRRSPWIATGRIEGLSLEIKRAIAIDLAQKGIETRPVFYPLPEMPAFTDYRSIGHLRSSKISAEGISLPTGPHVEPWVYEQVGEVIRRHCA
jgi:perosamine synthetase